MSSGDRLCECVSRGDAVAVIALLDSGVDPNYPSKLDGWLVYTICSIDTIYHNLKNDLTSHFNAIHIQDAPTLGLQTVEYSHGIALTFERC